MMMIMKKIVQKWKLTCPLSSSWLLVSFSLSNETTCFVHWEPLAGESGWTWILGGELGSDLPATTQLELRYNQIQSNQISNFLFLPIGVSNTCERHNDIACHPLAQSPSSTCNPNWRRVQTAAPEASETYAYKITPRPNFMIIYLINAIVVSFLEKLTFPLWWQSFRYPIRWIHPKELSSQD